jgi:hypothetical protein
MSGLCCHVNNPNADRQGLVEVVPGMDGVPEIWAVCVLVASSGVAGVVLED